MSFFAKALVCFLLIASASAGGKRGRRPGYGRRPRPGVGGLAGQNLAQVLPINKLNGGSYDPYSIWAADCNSGNYGYQRFMTGIWDDLNNFKDLDKVKCSGSAYGVTLNLKDNVVLDLQRGQHGLSQCPENYVMTALFDIEFGFPHPTKAKCSRVTYGYLDNYDILTLYTDHKSGGPYDNYQLWNVECPPESAMVGIKKEYGRTVAINCAPLKRHH